MSEDQVKLSEKESQRIIIECINNGNIKLFLFSYQVVSDIVRRSNAIMPRAVAFFGTYLLEYLISIKMIIDPLFRNIINCITLFQSVRKHRI